MRPLWALLIIQFRNHGFQLPVSLSRIWSKNVVYQKRFLFYLLRIFDNDKHWNNISENHTSLIMIYRESIGSSGINIGYNYIIMFWSLFILNVLLQYCTNQFSKYDLSAIVSECHAQFCAYGPDRVCELAENLINTCLGRHNVVVTRWRSASFCREFLCCFRVMYCSLMDMFGGQCRDQQRTHSLSQQHTYIHYLAICIMINYMIN
jgi:hypothetical protein